MKDVFCFGDAHSHYKSVLKLLQQEGLVDKHGGRHRQNPQVTVVSLGDLANGVASSRDEDLKALGLLEGIVDYMCLGNHESPYLNFPAFNGFFMFPEIKDKIRELTVNEVIVPCIAVSDILLSHAGVAKRLGENFATAQSAAQSVTNAFRYAPGQSPILQNISMRRGGMAKEGGILWSDWAEPKCQKFTQIVGHTVGSDIRYYTHGKSAKLGEAMTVELTKDSDDNYNPTYNIDIGCNSTGFYPTDAIAGAWIRDGGIEFVRYDG